ncbi:hypothetical protein PR048_001056 [Dryococelus australis]|uniref:Nuclease HARBI1 n=1 Tax=Dryococelus australis TaxID=614101 RepID=A0ABQ9IHL9_9NEOP|nr:hypothetical protein PR048_001056 [Dryococelus australis]
MRDSQNPCEYFSDVEFAKCIRFTKLTVLDAIVPIVASDNEDRRGLPVFPVLKDVIALRFCDSNSFQRVCGDLCHVNQATVSRIIKVVSSELAGDLLQFVHFPGQPQLQENYRLFYVNGGFPGVSGCIDCTHVSIRSPGGQFAEMCRNRKGCMSLNVQTITTLNCHFSSLRYWSQQQLQKTGTTQHIRGPGTLWKGCSEYGNEGLHAWAIDYEQTSIQPAGSSLYVLCYITFQLLTMNHYHLHRLTRIISCLPYMWRMLHYGIIVELKSGLFSFSETLTENPYCFVCNFPALLHTHLNHLHRLSRPRC